MVATLAVGCGDDPTTPPIGDGTVYNPYPPGLLPADLQSEIDRVTAEIDTIFQRALAQWKATPSPTVAGNPPILQDTGMKLVQILGKLELFDKTISVNGNVACTFCHMPYTGFSGPISSVNATVVAYPGSVHFRFGKRKPQAYTYSPFYPALDFNQTQQDFYGGNFWDLRATGYKIQSADAEQAQHPVVDTQEHGFPDTACVVFRLSQSPYRPLFELIWGIEAFQIAFPSDTERVCTTPGGAAVLNGNPTPVALSTADRGRSNATFDEFALSISAYERSEDVSAFSSKFDAFLAGKAQLTADEMAGWQLFRGKGVCNTCHVDGTENSTTPITKANIAQVAPLFTDFTSSNLGVPKNLSDPIYFENVPDSFGFTPNPAGAAFVDLGVGFFLRSQAGGINPNSDWTGLAPLFDGKMQTATTRNADMRPCPTFVKSYMHNGYLKSLKEVVHFYNTRDKFASASCTPQTEKVTCWPPPEVSANKDMTIGNLGLTDAEENQIVAFLQTLTDGFTRPYTDFDTFTGTCP
ncbi:MAG: Cytochrome c peroxidase family protein [Myxococcales bacterium]|nr:Cytochrome c peroxidase family protein [Myxococcales bacterium]